MRQKKGVLVENRGENEKQLGKKMKILYFKNICNVFPVLYFLINLFV